ncbi:hypothetical protein P7C73_g1909, partial [Tremellales sp. Uapishka_1]
MSSMERTEQMPPPTAELNGTKLNGGGGDSAPGKYIRWDAEGVEVQQPGEKEKIQAVSDQFNRFQQMNFDEHHHMYRGTHLKTQGCVYGKITVRKDLPEHLAQGMFRSPGTFDCIMRYSSLTPKMLPDTAAAPRGVAFKVFNIKGEKIGTVDDDTQDWTFNNYPLLELRDPKTTNEIADSLERNWSDADKFVDELKARDDADVACYAGGLKQEHMAAMDQYSQSAYRYGDYVAKLGLFPSSQAQKDLKSWYVKPDDKPNVLSTTLRDFHEKNKAVYSLQVQLLQNLKEQPVDDIGIIWDDKKYPFEEVATLEFEKQDSFIPAFRVWWDDKITCNTWHGLKEHTPLGSTNRMRKVVYAESRKLRMRINATECVEPRSLKEVPIGNAPIEHMQALKV